MEYIKKDKFKLLNHIQFLRGISVLLVFFYHLKLEYFNLGFLGVDIFFVISGFVITSIIHNEFEKTKKINFLNFYKKRFKRIYPVLIFIISMIMILVVFFQPLDLFLNNLKVYFFSLFGVSNFYYYFSKKDYFDTVFDDPLAHTWSLGVEEQFYIIFPLFLFYLLKYNTLIKNIYFLIFLIFIGYGFTNYFQEDIKLTFYHPLLRFWEFLFGTLTFFLSKKFKFRDNYLSIFVFFLLIFLIIFFKNISLPNIIMITCVLSSIFILIYKKNENKLYNLIVENKFLVFLGNISYSFYLWHLPIIYFYDLYFLNSLIRVPLLFLIISILSFFSYRFIESRYRYSTINLNFKNSILITSSLLIILLINIIAFKDSYNNSFKDKFKTAIYNLNYLENKLNYTDRVVFYKINLNGNEIYRFCTQSVKNYKLNKDDLRINCLKKAETNKRIFYIEGNSHTANFIPMFNDISINDNIYFNHKSDYLVDTNFKLINELQNSYKEVVYTTNISDEKSLISLLDLQKKFDKKIKILILGNVPNIYNKIEPLKCLIKNVNCEYDSIKDLKERKIYNLNKKIIDLTNNNQNISFFDPYKLICPVRICKVFEKEINLITHRDTSHLTIEGSLLMNNGFIEFYNKTYNPEILKLKK